MDYQAPSIYIFPLSERKRLKSKYRYGKIMVFLWTAVIFLSIGVGLGQWWRIAQIEPEHHAKVKKMQNTIEHYRTHWMPIREKENQSAQSTKGAGQKRGPAPKEVR